jgi:putative ABC transport system permease protein
MNTLKLALRNTFRRNSGNIIKILSLGVGFTIGLVLIAKIIFELSYDSCFPGNERIYKIYTNYSQEGEEMETYDNTSGAIAWGMKNEIPEVENATRYTPTWQEGIYTENRAYLLAEAILADENFFDVLYRPILIGNAKEIFQTPMQCLVSKTLAEKIGMKDIVGKTFTFEYPPVKPITIAGVFEDFPENSTIRFDVVISLKSISNYSWDGSENWIGNDRYRSYVKLALGVAPESLAEQVDAMFERNADREELEFMKNSGEKYEFSFMNIREIHKADMKTLLLLFGLLVAILLATSILNYVLVVISSLVGRTKEVAVHKCYGASGINITKLLFTETFIHLLMALIFSSVIILSLEDVIVKLLDTSLQALFAPQIMLMLALVCTLLLFVTGFLPAYLFSKIPVTAAFQKAREVHRKWKIVLIFTEVAATSFLVALLLMFALEYRKLIHENQGYSCENLLYVGRLDRNPATRNNIVQELQKMPEVQDISFCSRLPIGGTSGNYITEIGIEKTLFHIQDLYWVDENFLSIMEIPIVEGKGFVKGETGPNTMMVCESFVDKMAEFVGWKDGVVDKNISVSEHGEQTICGVFGNILTTSEDRRPIVIFYDPEGIKTPPSILLIKMHKITPEITANIYDIFRQFLPGQHIVVHNYKEEFRNNFAGLRTLSSEMLICSIVTLLIALAGLIGYIHNETNRRRAEIAIRKIHGATTNTIQGMFLKNILKPVLPAIIVGIATAVIVIQFLQQSFIEKVNISLFVYTLCAVCIASIILAVVSLNIYRAAARNPVENLE